MEIKGSVSSVVYRNNENGYSVVKIETDKGEVVATGKFPIVSEGEELVLQGKMHNNAKYGEQFEVSLIEINKPTDEEKIVRYLSSGLITGVGPVTARNIVAKFGIRSLDIIENDPEQLVSVKGVSFDKAMAISLKYKDIKAVQNAVIYLQQFDVSVNMALKIYQKYKHMTETYLKQNPYKMVEDIDGIGFRTADKIAVKMGIEQDSNLRLRAAVFYLIKEYSNRSGSTIINREILLQRSCELLNMNPENKKENFERVLVDLLTANQIEEHTIDGKQFIGLTYFLNMERRISNKISEQISAWQPRQIDVEFEIAEYEKRNNIRLHDCQKDAIKLAINNGVAIITGGPGTGKTTIIKAINEIFQKLKLNTTLLAPTGRAAKRLSEATGYEASTIHRALDINFLGEGAEDRFQLKFDFQSDVIVVDEFSMVDTFVMYNLVNVIKPGVRLIFVGDKDQLPSVGPGNVMGDLLGTGCIPTAHLTQIFRQADQSMIIVNAHRINNGEMVIRRKQKDKNDFFVIPTDSQDTTEEEILKLVTSRLPSYLKTSSSNIQVLCPMKKGKTGVENLNDRLQHIINPPMPGKTELKYGERIYRVGDKVMQTSNNYDQRWYREDEDGRLESGKGVFNGDIGVISEINKANSETEVLFEDGRKCFYSVAELGELMLSYAITIHKSQGSEFEAVVIPIVSGNPEMFTRNLLYTGVTRAKKLVVLVGDNDKIFGIIRNTMARRRMTMLPRFICDEQSKKRSTTNDNCCGVSKKSNTGVREIQNPENLPVYTDDDQMKLFDINEFDE